MAQEAASEGEEEKVVVVAMGRAAVVMGMGRAAAKGAVAAAMEMAVGEVVESPG